MQRRHVPRAHLVYDLLTDQLVGEIVGEKFQRFVAELTSSRKDHGGLDGTAYGFPDRTIYVPDAWSEVGRSRHIYPR